MHDWNSGWCRVASFASKDDWGDQKAADAAERAMQVTDGHGPIHQRARHTADDDSTPATKLWLQLMHLSYRRQYLADSLPPLPLSLEQALDRLPSDPAVQAALKMTLGDVVQPGPFLRATAFLLQAVASRKPAVRRPPRAPPGPRAPCPPGLRRSAKQTA